MSRTRDVRGVFRDDGVPTPHEIRALKAVADGTHTVREIARVMGVPAGTLSTALSNLYLRLGIDREIIYYKDARRIAVEICKREGWWDLP